MKVGTTLQPDWLEGPRKQALKYVLKWEIQSLLQRLAEIGEETVLLTADLEDGNAGQMGSDKGQGFLMMSGLQDVKAKFLTYCSECGKTDYEDFYRDLSAGEITSLRKTFTACSKMSGLQYSIGQTEETLIRQLLWELPDLGLLCLQRRLKALLSGQGNSRRKKGRKRGRLEDDTSVTYDPEVTFDPETEASEDQLLVEEGTPESDRLMAAEDGGCGGTVEVGDKRWSRPRKKRKLGPLSKRKKARKTCKADCDSNSGTDDNYFLEDHGQNKTGYHSDEHENSGNKSDEIELTGSSDVIAFQMKNEQSDQRTDTGNQSSDSEHSEDQSKDDCDLGTDDKKSLYNKKKKKEVHSKNLVLTGSPRVNNIESKLRGQKDRQRVNQSRPLLESDDRSGLNIELESPGTEESEELSRLIQSASCRTVLTEDGGMRIIPEAEIKKEVTELTAEELDNSPMYTPRPGSRHFKSANSAEIPSETALLDAAKLGVGRYQCPWCLLIVRDRHDLKRHIRTHTKEKPYHCELCGKNFSRKWDQENHMRRHQEELTLTKLPLTMVDLDELKLHSSLANLGARNVDTQAMNEGLVEDETYNSESGAGESGAHLKSGAQLESGSPSEIDAHLESGTQLESDSPSESDAHLESGTQLESGSPSESDAHLESGTQLESDAHLESGAILQSDVDLESGLPSESDAHLESGTQLESDAHLESGAQLESDAHLESGSPSESDAHLESGTQLESDAHLESGAHLESDAHLESGAILQSDTDLESGSPSESDAQL